MNTKLVDPFTVQVSDLDKEVTQLHDLLYELEAIWADLSYDRGTGIWHEDFVIRSWEEDLEEAVELETKTIPQQMERVRKLVHSMNQSYAQALGA
jgi:hypothetical protein